MNRGLKSFLRDHLLLTALVCTMSAVLLILATLQYRWSRQIREANEVRVGENLRAEMMDWHADLLHEFSSIALSLQVSPDSGAHDAREFQLLRYFADHPGKTLSRADILREVWGYKAETFTRTVDVHVASLRQKIEADPRKPSLITTVQGLGYKFSA